MKPALLLLIVLTLPLLAFAGEPTTPAVKTGEPADYTVIPLGEVKVLSVEEMLRSGGLITSESFSATKKPRKKKKKRLITPVSAAAVGLLSIASESARAGRDGASSAPSLRDVRAPELPGTTVTRAIESPEPGSAALCLLLLPAVVGYFRTRSKNA